MRASDTMSSAPMFAGTRVPVQNLFNYLESGPTIERFLQDFPTVSHKQAVDVLEAPKYALMAA
jgi:uncharacterized protein (DUF433 family)